VDHRLFDSAVATSAVSVKLYKKMMAFSGIITIGEEMCVSCFKVVFQHSVRIEENHGFLGHDSCVLAEIQTRHCRVQVRSAVIRINMVGKSLSNYHLC
jgi:hypothetical protein